MLERYTTIILGIKTFEEENADTFQKYNALLGEKDRMELDLKAWAKENGDVENGFVKVQKISRWSKSYDVETLKKDKKTLKILKDNDAYFLEEKVDKLKVDELAKNGKIDRAILREAYREEELSPAIKITVK